MQCWLRTQRRVTYTAVRQLRVDVTTQNVHILFSHPRAADFISITFVTCVFLGLTY